MKRSEEEKRREGERGSLFLYYDLYVSFYQLYRELMMGRCPCVLCQQQDQVTFRGRGCYLRGERGCAPFRSLLLLLCG